MKKTIIAACALGLAGCATIVNDPMIPVALSFSDGSNGSCVVENKRGVWEGEIPSIFSVRRSDDPLKYRCQTDDGRKANGAIESQIQGAKFMASVFLIDFGITDAITDKHREYVGSYVIPMRKQDN